MDTDSTEPSSREVPAIALAVIVGLVAWLAAFASAPRYYYTGNEDMGNNGYFPFLLGAAFAGGWLRPKRANLIGMALVLPGLALSPWTAPRGDNDGLWVLIIPLLLVFLAVAASALTAGCSTRVESGTM